MGVSAMTANVTRWLSVVVLGCMGACAPAADQPQLPPIPRASPGPVSPDGTYSGQLLNNGTLGGGDDLCGSNDSVTVTIRNARLRFVLNQPQVDYRRQIVFDLSVSPDGTFASPPGATYLRGTVAGGHLQGQVAGDACGFDMQADRTGTW